MGPRSPHDRDRGHRKPWRPAPALGLVIALLTVGGAILASALRPPAPVRTTMNDVSFVLPDGWTAAAGRDGTFAPSWAIVFFSTQLIPDACVTQTVACGYPADRVKKDGVFITWTVNTFFGSAPLPSGDPVTVGGIAAVRGGMDAGGCGMVGAQPVFLVTFNRAQHRDTIVVCGNAVSAARRAEIDDLLASIQWVETSEGSNP